MSVHDGTVALRSLTALRVRRAGSLWLVLRRAIACRTDVGAELFPIRWIVFAETLPAARRWPVFGFFLREYNRYFPDASLRIMALAPGSHAQLCQ